MLAPEPPVLDGRQAFLDAQDSDSFAGVATALGFFSVSWYGSTVSDERGSFGIVDPSMALTDAVGEIIEVGYKGRSVRVYVIGSQDGLGTDLGITRRCYMALELLAVEPITATIGVVA
jgi:hypothetical protein